MLLPVAALQDEPTQLGEELALVAQGRATRGSPRSQDPLEVAPQGSSQEPRPFHEGLFTGQRQVAHLHPGRPDVQREHGDADHQKQSTPDP